MGYMDSFNNDTSGMPKKRGLYHYIVSDLASQILSGDIPPESKLLTEQQLCQHYDVSRTVVRDALHVLTGKGLIEARPRSGTVVRPIEDWNFLDPELIVWAQRVGNKTGFFEVLIEARNSVEPQMAALAAQKATPEDIEKIEIAYQKMVAAFEKSIPDKEGFTSADIEFHLAILAATHNIILQQFGALMIAALRAEFELSLEVEAISERSLRNHGHVLEAIKAKNSQLASECIMVVSSILQEQVRTKIENEA